MTHRRLALHRIPSKPHPGTRIGACLLALVVSLSVAGCAYRMNIQQGNLVDQEAIEQVRVGMTRSQVQFLLGTPMIADPFHADRWDYPYYFVRGRQRDVYRRWFTVHFDNDRVASVEHHLTPEGGVAGSADTEPLEVITEADLEEADLETAARD